MKAPFYIALLGRLQISAAGRKINPRGSKERALLAYLAMSPGAQHSRDALCGLLWGERASKPAHDSLKQALHRLRLAFASVRPLPVLADRTSLTLDEAAVTVDVQRFERLIQTGTTQGIEQAVALFHGEPMEGLDLPEAGFEEWLSAERRRLRGLQLDAMVTLLDRYRTAGRRAEAAALARRVLALDPLRESVHRTLMRAYVDQGETGLALKQYHECCAVLRRELDVEPEPATSRLYRSLIRHRGESSHDIFASLAASIAVLPFRQSSGGSDPAGIAEAMAEDIVIDLSRWSNLVVSLGHGQGTLERPRFLVAGSLRRIGSRLCITARLIDGETGQHIWAERFDRAAAEFPAAQEEVRRIIVGTIAGRVLARETELAFSKPASGQSARDLLLLGNALSWDDPASAATAQQTFGRAIDIDPGYGRPYSLLATMLARQWRNDPSSGQAPLSRAFALAQHGAAHAGGDSTCHTALGYIHLERRNFDMALRLFERGVELNPANPWIRIDLAYLLTHIGRAGDAVELLEEARHSDPYIGPAWYWRILGTAQFVLRRYADALTSFERGAAGAPRHALAMMAACCAKLDLQERASLFLTEGVAGQAKSVLGNVVEKIPFKDAADRRHLDECLRLAARTPRRVALSRPTA